MKRIIVFLAPALIAAVFLGCSKDHDPAGFGKYESFMKKPANLVATFERSTDEISLSWEMPDTNSVKMFSVAWSDSNVFDLGRRSSEFTGDVNTTRKMSVSHVLRAIGQPANADSFIVYFTISALYSNETFNEFVGPRSDVDSALVYKK